MRDGAPDGDLRTARRFVERLGTLPHEERFPVVPPLLREEPYRSAWTNVEAALGSAPEEERRRRLDWAESLDRALDHIELSPPSALAARRAVRAILAQPWLLTRESLKFVYEPFESNIPLQSL